MQYRPVCGWSADGALKEVSGPTVGRLHVCAEGDGRAGRLQICRRNQSWRSASMGLPTRDRSLPPFRQRLRVVAFVSLRGWQRHWPRRKQLSVQCRLLRP
jgi:hypothetical protein